MALTKNKLKKELAKKSFSDAEGGNKKDPRILNYFDMKIGEKTEIILVPDQEGNLFTHFKKHGPQMKVPAAGSIGCVYHAAGESCPICAHGFDTMEEDKEKGKRFMAKDYYMYQCVVVNAPMEVQPLEDQNEVRIFYAPYAVHETIKEQWMEGIIEDPTEHIFVIKKTQGTGDNASYKNSYFNPKPLSSDVTEAFEDSIVEPYDLAAPYGDNDPVVPTVPTVDEAEEWLSKAIGLLDKKLDGEGGRSGGAQQTPKGNLSDSVASRLGRNKGSSGPSADYDDGDPDTGGNNGSNEEEESTPPQQEAPANEGKSKAQLLREKMEVKRNK